MRGALTVLGMLVLAVILVAGCEVFSPDENGTGEPAESSAYGGFTTTNEAPGFGDMGLLDGYPEDQPYADEMENDPDVRNGGSDRRARQYALRIIWGNVERGDSILADTEPCQVSDWSGALAIDGGVAIIKRLILFDRGDSIVFPRRGPRELRWVSYTKDHVDGLLFKIIDLPDPSGREVTNTITITTPFYTGEIPLAEL